MASYIFEKYGTLPKIPDMDEIYRIVYEKRLDMGDVEEYSLDFFGVEREHKIPEFQNFFVEFTNVARNQEKYFTISGINSISYKGTRQMFDQQWTILWKRSDGQECGYLIVKTPESPYLVLGILLGPNSKHQSEILADLPAHFQKILNEPQNFESVLLFN